MSVCLARGTCYGCNFKKIFLVEVNLKNICLVKTVVEIKVE